MKQIFSVILCFFLLCAFALPVVAAEVTEPTTDVPQPVPGASDTMAIVCLVIVVVGGAYLFYKFKRK